MYANINGFLSNCKSSYQLQYHTYKTAETEFNGNSLKLTYLKFLYYRAKFQKLDQSYYKLYFTMVYFYFCIINYKNLRAVHCLIRNTFIVFELFIKIIFYTIILFFLKEYFYERFIRFDSINFFYILIINLID